MDYELLDGEYPNILDLSGESTLELTAACDVMITDYSSIVFDSVYLGCPIIYFVPDYAEFLAGVSHNYRKLDLPLEEGFGPFTEDADSLIDRLEECIAAKIGYKIREAQLHKIPYMLLVGDKEVEDGTVSVRKRGEGDLGASSVQDFATGALEDVKSKKIW